MEYVSPTFAIMAKTNTQCLKAIQNMGLRIITGGMRSTPITAMESVAGLHSLHARRKEKVVIQAEKYKRLETHPMNQKNQEPNINRLKRSSFKHLSKQLSNENQDIISINPEEWEILTPYTINKSTQISCGTESTDTGTHKYSLPIRALDSCLLRQIITRCSP